MSLHTPTHACTLASLYRQIKNRESAARSRAKRQEYTATLEQQVCVWWWWCAGLDSRSAACCPNRPPTAPPFLPIPPTQQVEELKQQNLNLRVQVVTTAAAPPDPHAGKLDGELMRRSRTGPI